MPVFDFSNAPGGKKTGSICTYTTFQSNEKEKTPDEPILVLDNQSRQWKHHSGGVFAKSRASRQLLNLRKKAGTVQRRYSEN